MSWNTEQLLYLKSFLYNIQASFWGQGSHASRPLIQKPAILDPK